MKKIFFALFIVLQVIASQAQEKSGFIGLQAGPSIPLGKYHDVDLPDGGFATTGMSASLEGAWFFLPWLGVGGQVGAHLHSVNVAWLEYEKEQSDPFITEAYIRSDPYRNYTLYAGAYFQKPLIQRLSATAKLLGGVIHSESPYQLYKVDYFMLGLKYFEVTSAGDYNASFLAGAGLKYELKNCIGFTLSGEFTYNKVEFDFIELSGNKRTDEKVITFMNVMAGVYLKL